MRFLSRNIYIVFVAILSLSAPCLHAQQMGALWANPTTVLTGAGVVTGATAPLTYTAAGEVPPARIKNVVTLGLSETNSSYLSDNFAVTMSVTIIEGANTTTNTSFNQTLTLSYNKSGGLSYNPSNYVSFNNAQYVNVTINSVSATPATLTDGVNPLTLLTLKNEMRVWRTFVLAPTGNVTPTIGHTAPPSSPTPDELPVSWAVPSNTGNNGVQLEWSWVENEMRSYYSTYELLFRSNCSRLDLPPTQTAYNVPLYYDGTGQLFSRVRAINILSTGTLTYGPWSTVDSFAFGGHNNNLNWQVTTDYAEEGKRKAVMQYYDGSLRQRQTVTKNNTTNTTVSAETFYDGQGRPAIQVLPAPGLNSIIAYTQNLNLFNGQAAGADPAPSFDLQPVSGNSAAIPTMQAASGAALYYSADNPEIAQNANQNLPDAGGYPYTATRYTPDATGRIMTQSGVGTALTMGSGHETQYYYGGAAQEELDGLFGTEVGDFSHYFKNMVQDANGQMSVSYVDMHGRTVATALAGSPPPGITALNLSNYPGQAGTPITRNLLNGNSNAIRDNSIVSVATLLVPVTTAYNFTYSLGPQYDSVAQCTGSVCYNCLYDVQLAITDESGNQAPIILNYTSNNPSTSNSCGGPLTTFVAAAGTTVVPTGNTIQFTQTLLPGSYSIRKSLTVDQAAEQTYQAQNQVTSTCKNQQQLGDSVYQVLLATSSCNVAPTTAPCQSCLAKLDTYPNFKTAYLSTFPGSPQPNDSTIHALYSADSANCASLCVGSSQYLATLKQLMLADMTPYSGQYAQSLVSVPSPGTMFNKYNIFTTADGVPQPFYIHPLTASKGTGFYYDAAGNVDQSVEPNGILLGSITPDIFTGLFALSWAKSLLPYHPEYAQLLFAQTNLSASYSWIENFDTVSRLGQADSLSFTNSTGNTENVDPFFTLAPGYKATMTSYGTTASYYNHQSLWQMAYQSAISSTNSTVSSQASSASSAPLHPPFTGLTTAQQNLVWQAYQGLYMAVRDSLVTAYIKANSPNTDDSALVAQGFVLRFPVSNAQITKQYGWTGLAVQPAGSAPNVNMADSIQSIDTGRCGSYVATWMDGLSQCVLLDSNVNKTTIVQAITSALETVCKKGQDAANPFGSSTVAFNSPNDGLPRTFQAVINPILSSYGIDTTNQYCNPFVITWPKPYGNNPPLTTELMSGIDTCSCKQFATITAAAASAGYTPSSLPSLNMYLNLTYQDTLTQAVFNGLQQCGSLPLVYCAYDTINYVVPLPDTITWPCTGTDLHDNCADNNGSSCAVSCQYQIGNCYTAYYLALGSVQHRPTFLDCGSNRGPGCLTCSRLSALITSYKAYFGSQAGAAAPIIGTGNLTPAQISYNVTFAQYVNYQTGLQLNWTDYATAAAAASCNLANYASNGTASQTVVCASTQPLTTMPGILEVDSACANVRQQAAAIAQSIYQQRQSQLQANFLSGYANKCLNVQSTETFTVEYTNSEYHYTLYYYDQAGNLVKTVPPAGARPNFSSTFTNAVEAAKTGGTVDVPAHLLTTNYRYNSLNAVIDQQSPDAGLSGFWYDVLGRLVVSQNAQQKNDGNYSYTLYDAIGRITEVGQKPQSTAMTQTISQNATSLNSWIVTSGGTRGQITETVYDQPPGFSLQPYLTPQNLRNRVSYSYTKNLATDAKWYTVSYYTYDVHGNVDTLLQDYLSVTAMSAAPYKRINYDYDLVSGKVNGVDYQTGMGQPDSFYYRYLYDADNRLVTASSSRDSITWEQDAAYAYYKHGPLARTVLGQLQTQGVDYSYTLQGWLKGANVGNGYAATVADSSGSYCPAGSALPNEVVDSRVSSGGPTVYQATQTITFEAGFQTYVGDTVDAIVNSGLTVCTPPGSGAGTVDTASASGVTEAYPIALDAYSFSLHYYPQDYKPIGQTTPVVDVLQALGASAAPLYNGNIAAMAVVIDPAMDTALVYNYHYDQLNRLAQMDAYKGLNYVNHSFTPVHLQDYQERPTYDPNGNITTYVRHGYGSNIPMDSLTYNYYGGYNRLQRINDGAGGSYTTDLKDQGTGNNYTYDSIGNLKRDSTNGVSNIDWTVYGKIADLTNGSGTVAYTYDAAGNRITKLASGTTTFYVRDAQGNVISIYTWPGSGSPVQKEVDLYGSSRLGSVGPQTVASTTVALASGYGNAVTSTFTRGEKSYELSNHLGNILTTITDKKIAVPSTTNSSLIDHFTADIATAQDYYPFGMLMPGRTYPGGTTSYRYGFNGKENDNEVKGVGNEIDYGMRYYDPRAGRFMSIDPLQKKYPDLSPYQFASNSPVDNVDLDGRESYWVKYVTDKQTGNTAVTLVAVKKSWLDLITISHLVVKINDHDWQYDGDFVASNGELSLEILKIKQDPEGYFAKMQQEHKEDNEAIAKEKAEQKKTEEFMWAMAFGIEFNKGATTSTLAAAEEQSVAANNGNTEAAKANTAEEETNTPATGQVQRIILKDPTPPKGESGSLSFTLENGKINLNSRSTTSGKFDFVVTNEGKLIIGSKHFDLSNGANSVQAAGQITIYKGKVMDINNNSGHYKPSIGETENFGTILKSIGVDVSGANLNVLNDQGVKVSGTKL